MATWRTEEERQALQNQLAAKRASGLSQEQAVRQERYTNIYKDMTANPQKYYDAFGGNVSKYNRELSYYEYMGGISSLNLPEQNTRYAYMLDDMRSNKQKYMDAFNGDTAKYNSELNRVTELFGIEQDNAASTISLVANRPTYSFLQESGLDQYYQYDLTNSDDVMLQELGYAPTSFDYDVTDLAEMQQSGVSTKNYFTMNDDGTPTDQAVYLSQYYQYDENDPEDVLNRALGLMPKSFKYDNTDEDVARQQSGELPTAAAQYVANSEQFSAEYQEYTEKMQQYADELYAWKYGPKTGLFGIFRTAKPENPYPDGAPETVQDLIKYKTMLETPKAQTYSTDTPGTVEAPNFAFGGIDDLMLFVDDNDKDFTDLSSGRAGYFQASEQAIEVQRIKDEIMKNPKKIGEYYQQGLISQDQMNAVLSAGTKDPTYQTAAQAVYENQYIAELKEKGLYDEAMAQVNEIKKNVSTAMQSDYSADNFTYLKEYIDVETELGVDGGYDELQKIAVNALNGGSAKDLSEFIGNRQDEGWRGEEISGYQIKDDAEIQRISAQLTALGWDGKATSDNAAVQDLIDQATFRAMQLQQAQVQTHKDFISTLPSWEVATLLGVANGIGNIKDNAETAALEIAKAHVRIFTTKNSEAYGAIKDLVTDVAQSAQARQARDQEYLGVTKNGDTWGSKQLYQIASTATELGVELMLGGLIGSIGAGAGVSTETAAQAKALTGWRKVASKTLFSKELLPYFVSSLGANLAEGELEGRGDLQNWTISLATAYMEAKTESMFGFFSNGGSAYKIFKNGLGKLSAETLNSIGRTLLENTLRETLEEIIQDVAGNAIEGLLGGQMDEMDLGGTITTTMGVGLLLSLFGIPAGFKSYNGAKQVESAFNEMTAAYESGDTAAYNAAVEKMRKYLPSTLAALQGDFLDGSVDRAAELIDINRNLGANLDTMNAAMRTSMELRQAKEDGENVSQASIDFADAQANQQVGILKTMQGVTTAPATLYDQVTNSPELSAMVHNDGLASSLIRNNKDRLTDGQVEVLRQAEQAAQGNPYVNIEYDENTTAETLNKDVDKAKNKVKSLAAKREQMKKAIDAQMAKISELKGKAKKDAVAALKTSEMIKQFYAMGEKIKTAEQDVSDAQQQSAGYQTQQQYRAAFNRAATSPVQAATTEQGQTPVEGGQGGVDTPPSSSQNATASNVPQEVVARAQRYVDTGNGTVSGYNGPGDTATVAPNFIYWTRLDLVALNRYNGMEGTAANNVPYTNKGQDYNGTLVFSERQLTQDEIGAWKLEPVYQSNQTQQTQGENAQRRISTLLSFDAHNIEVRKLTVDDNRPEQIRTLYNAAHDAANEQGKSYKGFLNRVKKQMESKKTVTFSKAETDKLARQILREYSSKYNLNEFKKGLRGLFDYIANNENVTWDEIVQKGMEIASPVIENAQELDTDIESRKKEIREYLRTVNITLTEEQQQEAASAFDTYGKYRGALFNKVGLKKEGTPLDKVWQELSQKYPDVFDSDVNPNDMPLELYDIVQQLAPEYRNPFAEYDQDLVALDLISRMMDAYYALPEKQQKGQRPSNELIQARKYEQKRFEARQEAIRTLLKAVDLPSLRTTLETVADDKQVAMKAAGNILGQYSESKAGVSMWSTGHVSLDYVLNAFDRALDMIARETEIAGMDAAIIANMKGEISANGKKQRELNRTAPATTAVDVKANIASDLFGVGAWNAQQMGLRYTGNDENGESYKFLFRQSSNAYRTQSEHLITHTLEQKAFANREDIKKLAHSFLHDAVVHYKLQSGRVIDLTLDNVVDIWGNREGGNNIYEGLILSAGKKGVNQEVREGEYTVEDIADIASIISGENMSEQAQALADSVGVEKLKMAREVAAFTKDTFNRETYKEIKYGKEKPGLKTLLNSVGMQKYGIDRAIEGTYWMRTHAIEKVRAVGKAGQATPEATFMHFREDDHGTVRLGGVLAKLENHTYDVIHEYAYGLYLKQLRQVLNGLNSNPGVLEQVRQSFGDNDVNWLQNYIKAFESPRQDLTNVERAVDKVYNLAKLQRLISPTVWVKQISAIFNYASYLKPKYAPKLTQLKLTKEEMRDIYEYNPEIDLRKEGFSLRETTEAALGQKKLQEAMMKPLVGIDSFGVAYGYIWAKNQAIAENPGLKGTELKEAISQKAREAIESTQGLYAPHVSSMLATKKGFIPKFLTMYSTATNIIYNTAVGGVRDISTGKVRSGGKKFMGVILAMSAEWLIGKLISGDDKWKEETTWEKILDYGRNYAGIFYGLRNLDSLLRYGDINMPGLQEVVDFSTNLFSDDTGLFARMAARAEHQAAYEESGSDADLEKVQTADKRIWATINNLLCDVAGVMGIPLKSAEKYLLKRPMEIIGGVEGASEYNSWFGYGLEPSSNYESLANAFSRNDTKNTRAYIRIIINKGGSIENFLKAKTGGAALSAQQQYELTQLWSDVQLEMSLQEIGGE